MLVESLPSHLTKGQLHLREIIESYIPEYEEIRLRREDSRNGTQEYDETRRQIYEICNKIRESLFANYYVHTDSITAARLDNPEISSDYISWLEYKGNSETFDNCEIEVPLNRHFFDDDSECSFHSVSASDLAFLGGPQYDRTIFWLVSIASGRELSNFRFQVDYYPQDEIIRAEEGSSRLLAHYLLGEKTIRPRIICKYDCPPDPELNETLLELNSFFDVCALHRIEKYNKHGYKLHFSKPLKRSYYSDYNYPELTDEEYITCIKDFWSTLCSPSYKKLKHCFQEALKADYIPWPNGYSDDGSRTIFEFIDLARELNNLLNRDSLDPRSEFFLNLREMFQGDISTDLEKWFFKIYLPSTESSSEHLS